MHVPHLELDLRDARRLLVAGDVHGHLGLLTESLDRVGYDAVAGDRLVLLGDLLDRGPDVLAIHAWLEANPTVVSLIGNHDDMLLASLGLRPIDQHNHPAAFDRNGGEWLRGFAVGFAEDEGSGMLVHRLKRWANTHGGVPSFIDRRVVDFALRIAASPVAVTALTPGSRRVALVHADVPRATWAETVDALQSPFEAEANGARVAVTWERHLFKRMERVVAYGPEALAQLDIGIPDVDHVFLGHSIVDEPTTAANITWIDTGPYQGGAITTLDVDAWIDQL